MNGKIALLSRCKDEPYVKQFIEYYKSEGVDHIYIIDDDSKKSIYADIDFKSDPCLTIFFDRNIIVKRSINELYKRIKHLYEWIIYVDIDEYITTRRYETHTIKEELETTFKDVHCIKIPWVMMSANSIERNPINLLETNIYRWDHDKKHVNLLSNQHKFRCRFAEIEVKCIFKPKYFNDIFDHHPISPCQNCSLKIVDGVNAKTSELTPFYPNLREADIKNAYLLCYHYRIVSIENCKNKIQNNTWYQKYTLADLLSTDYPEVVDETLKKKIPKL